MPPKIEYFTQQRCIAVDKNASGFMIAFDGGGAIYNLDKRFKAPDEIVNTSLLEVIQGEEEDRATLRFGYSTVVNGESSHEIVKEVQIPLTDYAISDPRWPSPTGGVWTVEELQDVADMGTPPDPSAERVKLAADGYGQALKLDEEGNPILDETTGEPLLDTEDEG